MWTSVESPVGTATVIAHRDAVTAIEFEGPRQAGTVGALVGQPGGRPVAGAAGR